MHLRAITRQSIFYRCIIQLLIMWFDDAGYVLGATVAHLPWFLPAPQWRDLIWKFAKILWGQNFFLDLWGDKPLGSVTNILKFIEIFLKKNFTFCAFWAFKYVWPFVTTQHEWVNNFLGFIWKNINEKVGKLV